MRKLLILGAVLLSTATLFFSGSLLTSAYYAQFLFSTSTVAVVVPELTTNTTDFVVSADPSFHDYYDYGGYAPYRITRAPHCDSYDVDFNCVAAPDLCQYLSITPNSGEPTETGFDQDAAHPFLLQAQGELDTPTDPQDEWKLNVNAPCFEGECPANYDPYTSGTPLAQSLKGTTFKCDLTVESRDSGIFLVKGLTNTAYAQTMPNVIEVTATLTGAVTPTCTVNCNSNVMFLPGIMGSRLYEPLVCNEANTQCQTEQLWEPHGDRLALRLGHEANGSSTNSDIYVNGILDNVYLPLKGNIYKSFIHDMNTMVASGTINAWEAIPYDWRLTPDQILSSGKVIYGGSEISYLEATSSPYIIQELKRLAASSRTGKVTIVAHSNGGLITKALTEKLGTTTAAQLIDKIVFVAVPEVGTPKAIGSILHGFDQGIGSFAIGGDKITESAARVIAKNMPMAYNLLPSTSYFTYVDNPVATFTNEPAVAEFRARYGDVIHSKARLHPFMVDSRRAASSTVSDLQYPSVGNDLLLSNAESLHADIDNWVPPVGVKFYEVAGWGEETVSTIEYYQGKKSYCSVPTDIHTCTDVPTVLYNPKMSLDGDGTVVVPSALWTASSTGVQKYWVNLRAYNKGFTTIDRTHPSILEVDPLRTFIQDIISGSSLENLSSYQYISTSTPTNDIADTRLSFTLHSPLTLNLYDKNGNHTGISTTTGFLEENIPGSHYETFGEVKYISAPASSFPKLVLTGYETGSFTLDIAAKQGETVTASTTFSGIPSATSTVAAIDFSDGTIAHASALTIDENGDGHTDFSLAPKVGDIVSLSPPDLTPPVTTASTTGNLGTNAWYTSNVIVTLTATDTESGVASTTYSLNNGGTWLAYATPFSITTEETSTILYRSTDKAGNAEAIKVLTLKIDKTAPEAQISVGTTTQDILVEGTDNLGTTTITKDTSGNVTITDVAGHTAKLFFTKTFSGKILTYAKLTGIQYDNQTKITLPSSSFLYVWDTKAPVVPLSQTIAVDGTYLLQASYDKKTNKTVVIVLKKNLPIQTQTFIGLRIVKLTTSKGVVGYSL